MIKPSEIHRKPPMLWLLPLLLLAITSVYAPHLDNGLVFDDHPMIETNPLVLGNAPWEKAFTQHTWAGLTVLEDASSYKYYRPLFTLAHRITYQVGQGSPAAFHVLNLGLHLIATGLMFFALRVCNFNPTQSIIATTLFGLSPLAGEVVYWASCTGEILLQAGLLVSLICTICSFTRSIKTRILFLAGASIALLVALFSKETAVVIAPILTLEIFRHSRDEYWKRFQNVIPLWGITFGYLYLRSQVVPKSDYGGVLPDGIINIGHYGFALLQFTKKLVWPLPLNPFPFFPLNPSMFDVIAGLLFLLLLLALALFSLRYKPPGLFWLGWLILPLTLPLLQLLFSIRLDSGVVIAERYLYLSLIPFCALVVSVVARGMLSILSGRSLRVIGLSLVLVSIVSSALIVFSYGSTFSNDKSYFEKAYSKNPNNPFVLLWLGNIQLNQKEYDEAIRFYERAIDIEPRLILLHVNRGKAFNELGFYEEAATSFRRAIKQNRSLPEAHLGLANALRDQGAIEAAGQHYQEALKLDPDNDQALTNLATYLYMKGRYGDAVRYWEDSLEIKESPEVRFNLGMAYRTLGKLQKSKENLLIFLENADKTYQQEVLLARKWLGGM